MTTTRQSDQARGRIRYTTLFLLSLLPLLTAEDCAAQSCASHSECPGTQYCYDVGRESGVCAETWQANAASYYVKRQSCERGNCPPHEERLGTKKKSGPYRHSATCDYWLVSYTCKKCNSDFTTKKEYAGTGCPADEIY